MKRLQLFCHFRLVCSLKTFQRSYKEDCADCFSEEICKCLFLCLCVRSGLFFELPARQAATEMIHHLMGKKQTTHAGCVIETKQVFFFGKQVLFCRVCARPWFPSKMLKAVVPVCAAESTHSWFPSGAAATWVGDITWNNNHMLLPPGNILFRF